ncbi:TlpA family protein disulfide reductase [Deltaproteobacteria bacterium]|nr:TlpA family protein disulfide reductase [Deltaproteobacteria bacterium]
MRFGLLKILLPIICAAFLLVGCGDQSSEQTRASTGSGIGTDKGQVAPDFTLTDMQGQKVSLADMRGKVVILNFWATWCPPCREEMPSMEMLYRKYKDQGLVILAVNTEKDGANLVKNFLQKTPYTFPILLDTAAEVQNRYNVYRFPETYVLDRNGNVAERVTGAIDWTSEQTVKLMKTLLNG